MVRDRADGEQDADPATVARLICTRLLAHRARTRSELADRLAVKGIPADTAAEVLDRLTELGWVDDRQFAAAFAQTQRRERGASSREIERQLRVRGVQEETAREAAVPFAAASDEAAARLLVRGKLRSLATVDDATRVRRLTGLLARRGYSAGVCATVIRSELTIDVEAEESDDLC